MWGLKKKRKEKETEIPECVHLNKGPRILKWFGDFNIVQKSKSAPGSNFNGKYDIPHCYDRKTLYRLTAAFIQSLMT